MTSDAPPIFSAEPLDLPPLVTHLLGRTCRDGSLYIRKWIREEIRAADLRSAYKPKAGAPSAEEFLAGVGLLRDAIRTSRQQAIQTLASSTAKALDPETDLRTHAELLHSNEKQILNMPTADDLVNYFPDLLLNVTKPTVWQSISVVAR